MKHRRCPYPRSVAWYGRRAGSLRQPAAPTPTPIFRARTRVAIKLEEPDGQAPTWTPSATPEPPRPRPVATATHADAIADTRRRRPSELDAWPVRLGQDRAANVVVQAGAGRRSADHFVER